MNAYPSAITNSTASKQPAFLVFEGLDGCGKSRQVRRAASILREFGHRVCLTGEPTGFSTDKRPNVIGALARSVLRGDVKIQDYRALQLIYAADRLEHVAMTIQPALAAGEIVVCDRYDLSTLLYGMASVAECACTSGCGWTGSEDGLPGMGVTCPRCSKNGIHSPRDEIEVWLQVVGSHAPRPTATIIIDTPAEVCAARRKARKAVEFFDDDAFQATLAGLYRDAADYLPTGDTVLYVDGSGTADDVTACVRKALASAPLSLIPA